MVTANLATIAGLSLISAALVAVFFSPYRRWLSFMLAGMLAWGLIEVIRFGAQTLGPAAQALPQRGRGGIGGAAAHQPPSRLWPRSWASACTASMNTAARWA